MTHQSKSEKETENKSAITIISKELGKILGEYEIFPMSNMTLVQANSLGTIMRECYNDLDIDALQQGVLESAKELGVGVSKEDAREIIEDWKGN